MIRSAEPGRAVVALFLIAAVMSACKGSDVSDAPSGKRLDPAHLPTVMLGLMPGVSTEADVMAALPGAKVDRDHTLGGSQRVELSDEPAVRIESATRDVTVWLARVKGELRVASVKAKLQGSCESVLAELGDQVAAAACSPSNRRPDAGEHELCTATPDGAYRISGRCVDGGSLKLWLHLSTSTQEKTLVAPLDEGATNTKP